MSQPQPCPLYGITGALLLASPMPLSSLPGGQYPQQTAEVAFNQQLHPNNKGEVYAQQTAVLQIADLPSGFQEVPPMFKSQLLEKVAMTSSYLKQQGMVLKDSFALLNLTDFTIVLGLITALPTNTAVERFDTGLRRPNALQELTSAMKGGLNFLGPVNIKQQGLIPIPSGIGEVATGWAVAGNAGQFPLYADIVMFRRGKLGALTIVSSLYRKSKLVSVPEVARKLDGRLQKTAAISTDRIFPLQSTAQSWEMLPSHPE